MVIATYNWLLERRTQLCLKHMINKERAFTVEGHSRWCEDYTIFELCLPHYAAVSLYASNGESEFRIGQNNVLGSTVWATSLVPFRLSKETWMFWTHLHDRLICLTCFLCLCVVHILLVSLCFVSLNKLSLGSYLDLECTSVCRSVERVFNLPPKP